MPLNGYWRLLPARTDARRFEAESVLSTQSLSLRQPQIEIAVASRPVPGDVDKIEGGEKAGGRRNATRSWVVGFDERGSHA